MVYNTYCVVFGFVFLRLLYHMLPVSLDCSFFDDCLFSNVYLQNTKWTPLKTGGELSIIILYLRRKFKFHIYGLIVVCCCLTPLSTIFHLYRGGSHLWIVRIKCFVSPWYTTYMMLISLQLLYFNRFQPTPRFAMELKLLIRQNVTVLHKTASIVLNVSM